MVRNIGQNKILNFGNGEKLYVFYLPKNKLMYVQEKDINAWLLPNRQKIFLRLSNKVMMFKAGGNKRKTINSDLKWLLKPKPPVRRYTRK